MKNPQTISKVAVAINNDMDFQL